MDKAEQEEKMDKKTTKVNSGDDTGELTSGSRAGRKIINLLPRLDGEGDDGAGHGGHDASTEVLLGLHGQLFEELLLQERPHSHLVLGVRMWERGNARTLGWRMGGCDNMSMGGCEDVDIAWYGKKMDKKLTSVPWKRSLSLWPSREMCCRMRKNAQLHDQRGEEAGEGPGERGGW